MPGTRVMCPGFYMMCYYVAITMVDKVGGPVSKENAKKESCGSSRWPRSFVSHGMQDSSLAGRVTGVPGYPPGNRVLASVPSHRRAQPASCVLATGEVVSQQVAPSGMWPKTRGVCACANPPLVLVLVSQVYVVAIKKGGSPRPGCPGTKRRRRPGTHKAPCVATRIPGSRAAKRELGSVAIVFDFNPQEMYELVWI